MTKFNLANARFSFRHDVYKEDDVKAATVNVDGAWLDIKARKLVNIPEEWYVFMQHVPKADDYEEFDAL
ncbi:hypothetical protein HMPREF0765_2373 [Sphingobacterium spiritivorum ATCC 33300]|uniref:Uncharacterized protein n=1 Tax=Sphingobacterium spiritivorum ATCC 33300 TaxID=525372 RepID=C2FYG7_SPHSI|nr:hypothetical protein [Sphingobacterium spiritivorum]EEI92049.1 hypothetical protein HMPREF0765_2373 [Sphingobacterium spiritivorum ATCC 33300]